MENKENGHKEDPYAAADRAIEWMKSATLEERMALFQRAGVHNEKGELTKEYGGTGETPKNKRKLPV